MKYCPRYLPVTSNPHRKTGLGDTKRCTKPLNTYSPSKTTVGEDLYIKTHTHTHTKESPSSTPEMSKGKKGWFGPNSSAVPGR